MQYVSAETISSYRYRYTEFGCSKMTFFFFLKVPSFFFSDVYRGCPKQPNKPETFKGAYSVCAIVSKSQTDNELQSALLMQKCPA